MLLKSPPLTRAVGGGHEAARVQIPPRTLVRACYAVISEPIPGGLVPAMSIGDDEDPEGWLAAVDCENVTGRVLRGGNLVFSGKFYDVQTFIKLRVHEPFSGGCVYLCAEIVDASTWPIVG
jgi:hypothetical protein